MAVLRKKDIGVSGPNQKITNILPVSTVYIGRKMEKFYFEPIEAVEVIRARIDGEWDHPELLKIGYLSVDVDYDIKRIINGTLCRKASAR